MTPSLTQAQVDAAIRAFLLQILPAGVEVLIGQSNRVPEPTSDNYVIMWDTLRRRLGTTVVTWDQSAGGNPTVQANTEASRLDRQFDFHGAFSTDNAQVFATVFRSGYAVAFFKAFGFAPNYCSDGNQAPFINGEQQYEDRWTLTATFDANITVSTPQQFADTVTVRAAPVRLFENNLLFYGEGPIFFQGDGGSLNFYTLNATDAA